MDEIQKIHNDMLDLNAKLERVGRIALEWKRRAEDAELILDRITDDPHHPEMWMDTAVTVLGRAKL